VKLKGSGRTMAHIEAHNLTVRYPVLTASTRSLKNRVLARTTGGRISKGSAGTVEVEAVSDLSFRFERGERIALIGHNGSGKTTLLRVLGGIYHPSGGHIELSGKIAALFETAFGMDPDSTGYENITLRALFLGISRAAILARTDEIADFTGLGDFLDMPLRTYSAGMAARLAFAISTSVQADILLIDEGISAGDAAFADQATERLESFIERAPIVVFASHDEDTTRQFCTRGLVLQQGRLVFDGDLNHCYEHYARITGAHVG
jgi:ABC-2 type transport system ATP-binding protein/lipopolysaccharide transport system ATP-binding protein